MTGEGTLTDARDRSSDATRLAAASARIEVLEEELALQAQARADLIHLVSHELRTSITVISGFARLLQNEGHGGLNAEQHRFVGEGLKACRRLDEFVGDLLEARVDGETPFAVTPALADLHETIEAQLESLMPLLEERGSKVEVRLNASAAMIPFDARRIEQVVTNLMTNAIRYGRESGVIQIGTRDVQGEAAGVVEGGPAIEVSVEDDGTGIPEGDRERLFAPFVRGAAAHKTEHGLGIGLAICRRIIVAHHGTIHVEAGAQGGARFVFRLPREIDATTGRLDRNGGC